jgi:hypothetical protein
MGLYYLPLLIRSDRYFIARLEKEDAGGNKETDYDFVVHAEDRVPAQLLTIEDPDKVVLNQMAPADLQDVLMRECHLSLAKKEDACLPDRQGFELLIKKSNAFAVEPFYDEATGVKLDYSKDQKRITLGYYKNKVEQFPFFINVVFQLDENNFYTARFHYAVVPSRQCQRVVIDFGSEASQVGYKNCGPQSSIIQYDILENIISQLKAADKTKNCQRDDFLNNEPGQQNLYSSFYAVKKRILQEERKQFPFNFTNDIEKDEIRLFITKQEVAAAMQSSFRDEYEIVPNLKLGIEKSLQLICGDTTEDYSIREHKKELISAILLRLLRLMIATKPDFRKGGIIVTLLVPNIYTQQNVFDLLNELRSQTVSLLASLEVDEGNLFIEYETISESDAAFMGYQQTQSEIRLHNGEIALVIDCGKGTTDISMVLADDNENYCSFFRTGFAGAGNVLSYGFAEDFLTLALRAIPGHNEFSVKDFIQKNILEQNLTVDVLNFLQLIETQKKKYNQLPAVGLLEFEKLTEQSEATERSIANLYKDQATLLQYAEVILKDRNIRWDNEITGIIQKATDCIVQCIIASIRDVITKDIKKRIKVVMLSGRAFYFEALRTKLEEELNDLLGEQVSINTVTPGRAVNNKNVALHGAFSGAYKITDFTGIPIDKKEGLSKNNDIVNNNAFLYHGIKIEPGNDIIYNTSIVRRNNQALKAFRNKTMDIFFTRDNIYLRLMENQKVKDVRSLYSILTSVAEVYSPIQDLKAISMFPSYSGELASIVSVYKDISKDRQIPKKKTVKKKAGILQFFNL